MCLKEVKIRGHTPVELLFSDLVLLVIFNPWNWFSPVYKGPPAGSAGHKHRIFVIVATNSYYQACHE